MSPWVYGVKGCLVGAIFLGCSGLALQAEDASFSCGNDIRCHKLRDFFSRNNSPLVAHVNSFLVAAELNKLDWRLLPAISAVETSAGKHCRRHNIFGWNSGRASFKSVAHAIGFVASRFSSSPIYAGKSARDILHTYNPYKNRYSKAVIPIMQSISPEPVE
jgi:hypothetical protein